MIKKYMAEEVYYLNPNDNLATARNLFLSKKISHILVLDDEEELIGILTERDLAVYMLKERDERALNEVPISEVMTENPITIEYYKDEKEVIKKMIENKISCLPVMDKNKVVGIITKTDLLKYAFDTLPDDKLVENYMSKNVVTIKPYNSILQAVKNMKENKIKKLVVVEGKTPIGIISERDVSLFEYARAMKKLEVGERKIKLLPGLVIDAMREHLVTCKKNDKLKDVAKKMIKNKVGSCVVVDEDNHLEGIITNTDVLRGCL
jgi:CBS domain-containing protein